MRLDKKAIEEAIQNGATIADLAAIQNISWDEAALDLDQNQIQRPNAQSALTMDVEVRRNLSLTYNTQFRTHEEFVLTQSGAPWGIPPNFSTQSIDLNKIFEHYHGPDGYIDPYNGEPTNQKVYVVNSSEAVIGKPRNFLITNIETLSKNTIETRFCSWMRPVQETFEFEPQCPWKFELTISRAYDKLVGGTFSNHYMNALFSRWVGQPLEAHCTNSDPEREPVFRFASPMEAAWWSWEQLTHAGLLKGLIRLKVTNTMHNHSVVLRDDDVQNAILGFLMKDRRTSSILMPGNNNVPGLIGR